MTSTLLHFPEKKILHRYLNRSKVVQNSDHFKKKGMIDEIASKFGGQTYKQSGIYLELKQIILSSKSKRLNAAVSKIIGEIAPVLIECAKNSKKLIQEQKEQEEFIVKSSKLSSRVVALIIPARTDNLKNFEKDFFIPTTMNVAFMVKNIVARIFALLGSLLLDMITFPIRVVTCIPKVLLTAKKVAKTT